MAQHERVELADFIKNVRLQLQKSQRDGRKSGMKFRVPEVELEVAVVLDKGGDGKFSLLGFELGGEVSKQVTQRVKIKLVPEDADGGPTLISDVDDSGKPVVIE